MLNKHYVSNVVACWWASYCWRREKKNPFSYNIYWPRRELKENRKKSCWTDFISLFLPFACNLCNLYDFCCGSRCKSFNRDCGFLTQQKNELFPHFSLYFCSSFCINIKNSFFFFSKKNVQINKKEERKKIRFKL